MTILQLQILKILSLGPLHGKELRDKLKWSTSNPGFFQLMGRMKKSKLIEWSYVRVNDHRESIYSITSLGKEKLKTNLKVLI